MEGPSSSTPLGLTLKRVIRKDNHAPELPQEMIMVHQVIPGSSGAKADLRPEDALIKIDGKPCEKQDLGTITNWLKASTDFNVDIMRATPDGTTAHPLSLRIHMDDHKQKVMNNELLQLRAENTELKTQLNSERQLHENQLRGLQEQLEKMSSLQMALNQTRNTCSLQAEELQKQQVQLSEAQAQRNSAAQQALAAQKEAREAHLQAQQALRQADSANKQLAVTQEAAFLAGTHKPPPEPKPQFPPEYVRDLEDRLAKETEIRKDLEQRVFILEHEAKSAQPKPQFHPSSVPSMPVPNYDVPLSQRQPQLAQPAMTSVPPPQPSFSLLSTQPAPPPTQPAPLSTQLPSFEQRQPQMAQPPQPQSQRRQPVVLRPASASGTSAAPPPPASSNFNSTQPYSNLVSHAPQQAQYQPYGASSLPSGAQVSGYSNPQHSNYPQANYPQPYTATQPWPL